MSFAMQVGCSSKYASIHNTHIGRYTVVLIFCYKCLRLVFVNLNLASRNISFCRMNRIRRSIRKLSSKKGMRVGCYLRIGFLWADDDSNTYAYYSNVKSLMHLERILHRLENVLYKSSIRS